MTDLSDFTRDDAELIDLIESLFADDAFSPGSKLLDQLRIKQKQARAAIEQKSERFKQLCEEVARGDHNLFNHARMADLARMADPIHQSDKMAKEKLRLGMEAVQEKLKSGQKLDPGLQEFLMESVGILVAWLELQKKMRDKLLELFPDRRSGPVLYARPVSRDIDHEALTDEIIARFPNILAALAE
jgi:hypothetical protein